MTTSSDLLHCMVTNEKSGSTLNVKIASSAHGGQSFHNSIRCVLFLKHKTQQFVCCFATTVSDEPVSRTHGIWTSLVFVRVGVCSGGRESNHYSVKLKLELSRAGKEHTCCRKR